MAEDIAYDSDFTTSYDDVGDIATVDGEAQIRQAIVTTIAESIGFDAPPLTPDGIEEQRSLIEDTLDDSQYTQGPVIVEVDDTQPGSVTYTVTTQRVELPLTFGRS